VKERFGICLLCAGMMRAALEGKNDIFNELLSLGI
jgi:hypothetical protein